MITLHHLNNSRSQRILWLLEELGVEYQIQHYSRNLETQLAPDELKKIHPLGKSPLITDSENDDKVIAESAVIIDYLIERFAPNWQIEDSKSDDAIQMSYWMHYAEGSLMPPLLLRLIFEKIKSAPMPFFVKPIAKGIANKVLSSFVTPNVKANMNFVEQSLDNKEWLVGDALSAADIQMSFPLEACVARGIAGDNCPNIRAYIERIHARPAYQQALSKGGKYDYASLKN